MKESPQRPDESGPADLVAGVLGGSSEALDAWYRAEHPVVHRLCLGFLAHVAEADDVAQDAMLHLHDRLDRWDAKRPYKAWRTTVVLNLCRDRLRRLGTRRTAETAAGELVVKRPLPRPDEALQQDEIRRLLGEALTRLPEREREAFVLRDLEGVSTRDTASALGINESSVRSLLTLARRRLRNLLGPALAPAAGGSHA